MIGMSHAISASLTNEVITVYIAGSISSGLVLLPLVGNRVSWRRGRQGRAGVAGLSFIGSWLWSDAPYARFVVVIELPDSPCFRAGGPYNVAPYLFLCCRPLTTLGHLPPTAVVESQWGEPRSDASGTSVHVAGLIPLWPVLLPIVGNLPPPDSPRRQAGGTWSVAPYLFLRRRPLTTLGCPPPTAIAESQWGEPHSDAFGTGTHVAVLILLWPVLLPVVSVGEEEGGAGQECLEAPGVLLHASAVTLWCLLYQLSKEKETTEAYLSEDIVTVVACLLQCLQILCIINKPKAAAIAYGLDKKSSIADIPGLT
ncbi:hypothetical protein EDB85DRAFT_1896219 [Lactarius pseudohatsudake]|nr:hypothetical protein EDB85DRAFT_1896219 [Lactarius pseudohatsudake]